jgi:hypothetical protein
MIVFPRPQVPRPFEKKSPANSGAWFALMLEGSGIAAVGRSLLLRRPLNWAESCYFRAPRIVAATA